MAGLLLIVPVVSVAVVIWRRRAAARQVGLPPMTPVKLSAAVSRASKLGQDALSVTLAPSGAKRAVGPMAAIGWQLGTATAIDRSFPAQGTRTTITFSRASVGPRYRYEYLYDRDTWVRLPTSHCGYLGEGSTPTQP